MAADMGIAQKLESEIICGICWNHISQPITMDCGHNFCQECLSWSWTVGVAPFSCPECRQVSQIRELPARNVSLENLTDIGKQLSSHRLQSTEGQRQCPTHKKVFEFFCEEDQTLLCVSCCQMPEHEAHKLSPIEEAAHNYRKKLHEILNRLGKDFDETEKLLPQQEEVRRPLVDWVSMISGEYYKLHYFVMEEELECGEILEAQIISNHKLSRHIQTLQEIIQEMDESSLKPNLDLLQDFTELLGRSESLLSQRSKAVIPELEEFPITALIDILNKFRVDISVDPKSDPTYVIVSEDLRSMRAGEGWQVEPNQPEDPVWHYVFAEQFFTSGRHYWEVDVTQIPQWVVGIYTPFLSTGMGRNPNSLASVFLLRCVKKKDHYNFQTYPGSLNHQAKDPVPRVGVFLEYSFGEGLFYNVLQRSLIYRFCPIPFTEPAIPVFSPGPPLSGTKPGTMTICPVDSHLCACCYSSSSVVEPQSTTRLPGCGPSLFQASPGRE
ncbi:tripartite motif-containing protein 64-like [Trichosurus vulpecula]|uniref:tripartite motif-containing protein 64-like n=1 Tax=Trichosurus vulpecula TaxID=9337 RepID=UPI00186B3701|nr:tripartite motif-containing protein 64-like [Trichosurus vulpecula]